MKSVRINIVRIAVLTGAVSGGAVVGGSAVPVAASAEVMPTGTFRSCAALHGDYPAGIARTKRAADRIVRAGYERPIVCKRVYRQVGARLDPNRNGVACEVR